MSEAGNWEVVTPMWRGSRIKQKYGTGRFISILIDQFGRCRSISYNIEPPLNLSGFLHRVAIPEARLMVPPVRGRYGRKLSPLRRAYCEALALVLQTRFVPEAPEPGQ